MEDKNGNGIQENDEVGITGVRITLSGTDAWGQNISLSKTTDITGFYSFTNLIPGVYNVSVEIPSGYKFVPSQRGNDKEKDSDGSNGLVSNVVVTSNQHIGNIDFGFYKVGQIGDFVWPYPQKLWTSLWNGCHQLR